MKELFSKFIHEYLLGLSNFTIDEITLSLEDVVETRKLTQLVV
jgi:hypothetical protein